MEQSKIKTDYTCRFCGWHHEQKKTVQTFMTSIKRHLKTKHNVVLTKNDMLKIVRYEPVISIE